MEELRLKLKNMLEELRQIKIPNILYFILTPVLVMAVVLLAFSNGNLYPFGNKSVSWCDMSQQTIPLLIDFKDILDGKSSMFLNFENAGGMNFWGVFFFFLASPFNLLVKFVDKSNVILFVNILCMLKMMVASLTAMIYFIKCHKWLAPSIAVILSFMYGVCGYVMMFYQNIIWLDMMYLLPLLLLSLDLLVNRKSVVPYTVVLSAMLIVNYYISYMTVVFILLFMGVYILMQDREKVKESCLLFVGGSFISALVSAVVWLPSFIQYLSSGRKESLLESLANSKFITDYYTTVPMIFCTVFMLVVVAINAFSGQKREKTQNMYLYLFLLTLLPLVIEPINKMWHTGTYMSFPMRYGFITIFLGLICCAGFLGKKQEYKGRYQMIIAVLLSVVAIYLYYLFTSKFVKSEYSDLTTYTRTLWGEPESFVKFLAMFIVAFMCYMLIYLFYRNGYMFRSVFVVLIGIVMIMESYYNINLYMISPSVLREDEVSSQQTVLDLADRIDDDSFYRVKTSSKLFDYNLVGSLGYPSISHYTSLTDKDYMFTMKRLGYTSVWMEIGSCGGTSLTDALLCADYEITDNPMAGSTVYNNEKYYIQHENYSGGLGLIVPAGRTIPEEIPEKMERTEVQGYLYENLFGKNDAVVRYSHSEADNEFALSEGYNFSDFNNITYNIYVNGKQKLYFDCFDQLTNNLSEPIYDSFQVEINNRIVEERYPYNKNNGVLYLGEYSNESVTIKIRSLKSLTCSSFGVFGINQNALDYTINNADHVNLRRDAGTLTGSYTANEGERCFLSIPYSDGFTIRVNGEKVDYTKAFSAFISFPLQKGTNEITVTYTPKGFVAGLIITIIGLGITVMYIIYRRKLKFSDTLENTAYYTVLAVSLIVIMLIYIFPVVVKILA